MSIPSFDSCMKYSSGYTSWGHQYEPQWNIVKSLYNTSMSDKPTALKIPKIIHQIWLGSKVPDNLVKCIDTVKKCNPDYTHFLWTDDNIDSFDFKNKELFNSCTNFGQKSDILRYALLQHFGGIYLDSDFICYKSFDSLLHLDFFVGVAYDESPTLFNGLIGTTKDCPIIHEANNILEVRSSDGMDIIKSTGPWFLTKKVFSNLKNVDKAVILPVSYFYPYPNFDRDRLLGTDFKTYIQDETICVHLWESRWN